MADPVRSLYELWLGPTAQRPPSVTCAHGPLAGPGAAALVCQACQAAAAALWRRPAGGARSPGALQSRRGAWGLPRQRAERPGRLLCGRRGRGRRAVRRRAGRCELCLLLRRGGRWGSRAAAARGRQRRALRLRRLQRGGRRKGSGTGLASGAGGAGVWRLAAPQERQAGGGAAGRRPGRSRAGGQRLVRKTDQETLRLMNMQKTHVHASRVGQGGLGELVERASGMPSARPSCVPLPSGATWRSCSWGCSTHVSRRRREAQRTEQTAGRQRPGLQVEGPTGLRLAASCERSPPSWRAGR